MSTSRRVPLANNHNAINSPFRAAAQQKQQQKRSYATVQREEAYGQPPPAKRQMVDTVRKSPNKPSATQLADDKFFSRGSTRAHPNAFDRKLEAVRTRHAVPSQVAVTRIDREKERERERGGRETLTPDVVRTWQKHYRKLFPSYVFYFDNVPEDAKSRYVKQIGLLGAREEKFFSNAVTHVVTTRPVPPPLPPSDAPVDSYTSDSHDVQTINPLLLDRSSESSAAQSDNRMGKNKFTFEVPLSRRATAQDHDVRRQLASKTNLLDKARDLGIKIWALDKLGRMMVTMFETENGHHTRSQAVQETAGMTRSTRNPDLFKMLRQEKVTGPSDRDPTVDMNIFKGPFIYIHDIDEKQRPIMVREYAKVSNKEEGDWPQFRSVANGKCPFVEEVDHDRRDQEREQLRRQRQAERERAAAAAAAAAAVPRTRAAVAEAAKMQPPKITRSVSQASRQSASLTQQGDEATTLANIDPDVPSAQGPQNAFVSRAAQGRLLGGEPMASGVQQNTVTSAIKSQMISSTAAGPGIKAGTSKEIHGLQRKVLERTSNPASLVNTSSHLADMAASLHSKSAEDKSTNMGDVKHVETTRKTRAVVKRRMEKRDPKPGYCENCMDKFDDFDEHVASRKHRKFAADKENWAELDHLLAQLDRPLRTDINYN